MAELRVVIADDEPHVLAGIRRVLEAQPDIVVAGEARHGREAVELITALRPGLVFLDVQMPELDGLEVVRRLAAPLPGIVFVTAYDRYAVQAFELHALDYLLKPFDDERLVSALERARARLAARDPVALAGQVAELLALLRPDSGRLTRFLIRSGERSVLVQASDVDWIEAADNYARLHVGGARHALRMTMKQLEERLDPSTFVRVHRSAIVNLSRVQDLRPLPGGDQQIRLRGGASLTLSRRYRDDFLARVGAVG